MSKTPVLIASDHAGVALKAELKARLPQFDWIDRGPFESGSVDYPDYALTLGNSLLSQDAQLGVLICGSGVGMSIAANKIHGIRAALVENPVAARLSKEHNNSNVLCLGSRFIAPDYASEIVTTWIETPFSGEARHTRRIEKLQKLEKL